MATDPKQVETIQCQMDMGSMPEGSSVPEGSATQIVFVSSLPGDTAPTSIADSEALLMPGPTENVPRPEHSGNAEDVKPVVYAVDGNERTGTTLLDMNEFMEVVYTYKCRFCTFNTNLPDMMSQHVLSLHIERPLQGETPAEDPLSREESREVSLSREAPREVSLSREAPREVSLSREAPREVALSREAPREALPGEAPGEVSLPGEAPREVSLPGEAPREVSLPGELAPTEVRTNHEYNALRTEDVKLEVVDSGAQVIDPGSGCEGVIACGAGQVNNTATGAGMKDGATGSKYMDPGAEVKHAGEDNKTILSLKDESSIKDDKRDVSDHSGVHRREGRNTTVASTMVDQAQQVTMVNSEESAMDVTPHMPVKPMYIGQRMTHESSLLVINNPPTAIVNNPFPEVVSDPYPAPVNNPFPVVVNDPPTAGVNDPPSAGVNDPSMASEAEAPVQEIFMCGQCNQSFFSIDQCKQHMVDDHNINLTTELQTEEIHNVVTGSVMDVTNIPGDATPLFADIPNVSAESPNMFVNSPLNMSVEREDISATVHDQGSETVSIGTQAIFRRKPGRKPKNWDPDASQDEIETYEQAMKRKKPGRKRKQPESEVTAEDVEGGDDEDEEDMLSLDLDIKEEMPDEFPIFNTDFLSGRVRDGKRRIKMPQMLQDNYYVSSKPSEKRESPSADDLKRSPKTRKPRSKPIAYRLKCKVFACKAKFHTELSLEEHMNCHNSASLSKGFTCSQCVFKSKQWNTTRLHLWTKHNIDLDLLQCEQCEYRTDAQHKMTDHQLTHGEEKGYLCDTCHKAFKQLSQLIHHAATHRDTDAVNAQPKKSSGVQCLICQRMMADKKCLAKHIEYVHHKVKQFSCTYCDHTASRKHMVEVHMRTHTGERPYKCDLCVFATSDHNTLRRHRLRHTGEKPYKCKYCPYACIQAISLKIHMKSKHRDEDGLFYCKLCHYHTVNEKYWENHKLDHKQGLIAFTEEPVVQKVESDNKKKKSLLTKPNNITLRYDGNETFPQRTEPPGAGQVTIQRLPQIPAAADQVTSILPIDQSDSDNVQFLYYAVHEGGDGTQLVPVITQDVTAQDTGGAGVKRNIQTVHLDGLRQTVTFTIEPGEDGAPHMVISQDATELMNAETGRVAEVDTSALEAVEVIGEAI